jgi:hypothetical protein
VILDNKDEDQVQEETGSKKLTSPINGNTVLRNIGSSKPPEIRPSSKISASKSSEGRRWASWVLPAAANQPFMRLCNISTTPRREILINDINIKDYQRLRIHHLRASMGVAS